MSQEFNHTAVRTHLLDTGRYQAVDISNVTRLIQRGKAQGLAPDAYWVPEMCATLKIMVELYQEYGVHHIGNEFFQAFARVVDIMEYDADLIEQIS